MTVRCYSKLVHEGDYVAKVDVELIDTESGWSTYLTLEDADKLDDVGNAFRRGDLKPSSRLARVYALTPIAPQYVLGWHCADPW